MSASSRNAKQRRKPGVSGGKAPITSNATMSQNAAGGGGSTMGGGDQWGVGHLDHDDNDGGYDVRRTIRVFIDVSLNIVFIIGTLGEFIARPRNGICSKQPCWL